MRRTLLFVLLVAVVASACSGDDEPAAPTFAVDGYVHAGPVCPVVQDPPQPGCDDFAVEGARMVVLDAAGEEVVSIASDDAGRFSLALPAGSYRLVPQPVDGLLGTAEEQAFDVGASSVILDVAYDTGIR